MINQIIIDHIEQTHRLARVKHHPIVSRHPKNQYYHIADKHTPGLNQYLTITPTYIHLEPQHKSISKSDPQLLTKLTTLLH